MQTTLKQWKERGGKVKDLAEVAGTWPSNASDWINGKRPIPQEMVPAVARFTGLPVEELRPDLVWLRFRGRPVIDPDPKSAKRRDASLKTKDCN